MVRDSSQHRYLCLVETYDLLNPRKAGIDVLTEQSVVFAHSRFHDLSDRECRGSLLEVQRTLNEVEQPFHRS